jgi:hypothetical protein
MPIEGIGSDELAAAVVLAAVVLEAVLVGWSPPRSRKKVSAPTPSRATTTAAMIHGSGLFFCGGCP